MTTRVLTVALIGPWLACTAGWVLWVLVHGAMWAVAEQHTTDEETNRG